MTKYEKFNELLKTNKVTPYRVHKATGISTATLSDWKNGKSEPKSDKIQAICDFFQVPISYFYEDDIFTVQENEQNKKPTANSSELNKKILYLESILEKLNPDDQLLVLEHAQTFAERLKKD